MTRLLERLLGRLPVGWLQLTHSRGRLAAAIAGVAFANVLVLVQLGISGALNGTIAQGYEVFRADLLLSAPDANTLTEGSHVARQYLWQALADQQVTDGAGLYIGNLNWPRPDGDATLQTFGIDPAQAGFLTSGAAAAAAPLALADRAIIDRMTRGLDGDMLDGLSLDTPLSFEAAGRTLHVTGSFRGGVGFSADGYLIVSDQTFLALFPRRHAGAPNHLLLRLAPGADPDTVSARLRDRLGADLRIRALPSAIAADQRYQGTQRPTGIIFGFGVVIGVLVGIVIVYQVLSTDVADHLREYATFKAVGYPHRFFIGIILEEALILAALGFLPGIVIATGLYAALNAATGLPLVMTWQVGLSVLMGTMAACALSGTVATAKGLSQLQQDNGAFNLALCHAMKLLREQTRASTNPTYAFSINKLNELANRLFIKTIAETLFGQKIRIGPGTGGKHTSWTMPKGRTLLKHFLVFEGLHHYDSPLDALVSLDHLKGNRASRICWRVRELMTQAWTEIGLDTKSPSHVNAYLHFKRLIFDENAIRVRNELPQLRLPAASTFTAHVRALQTPLEHSIATKGDRGRQGTGSHPLSLRSGAG